MRILYVTSASFLAANAAALRNIGLASALAQSGHEVAIATPDDPSAEHLVPWAPPGPAGVTVVPVGKPVSRRAASAKVAGLLGYSHGDLQSLLDDWAPDLVILYQSYLPLLVRLGIVSLRRGTPVVLDVTEWYDGVALPLGKFGPHNALNQISMRLAVPRMPASIAISQPLAAHCARFGARTIVVPPLFDLAGRVPDQNLRPRPRGQRLTIAVTGSGVTAGQKDNLALMSIARAAHRIDPDGKRLLIKIAGPGRRVVAEQLGGHVPTALDTLGGLSWTDSLRLVASADFSLVLRDPSNRRAALGFPSKVPESLLLGTPILGNPIGDLDRYLVDGFNAAIVDPPNTTELEDVLRRLIEDAVPWNRDAILADAETHFTPVRYAKRLNEFVTNVVGAA